MCVRRRPRRNPFEDERCSDVATKRLLRDVSTSHCCGKFHGHTQTHTSHVCDTLARVSRVYIIIIIIIRKRVIITIIVIVIIIIIYETTQVVAVAAVVIHILIYIRTQSLTGGNRSVSLGARSIRAV